MCAGMHMSELKAEGEREMLSNRLAAIESVMHGGREHGGRTSLTAGHHQLEAAPPMTP